MRVKKQEQAVLVKDLNVKNPPVPEFMDWWKEHRHSGYCYRRDQPGLLGIKVERWSITPNIAWTMPRYRVEFEAGTGIDTNAVITTYDMGGRVEETYPARREFSEHVIIGWLKEQKEATEYANANGWSFDAEKNEVLWNRDFKRNIRDMAFVLAEKFQVQAEDMP
jgi:hypothetical protein